jgi:hypothetical protein
MKPQFYIFILTILMSLNGIAQESEIAKYAQPLDNYISDYRDKHNLINDFLKNDTTLTLTQKLQEYEAQMGLLKKDFKQKRKAEYDAIEKTTSVSHSCTKGNSGGTKKCGTKCTSPPTSDFYTKAEWITKFGQGSFSVNGDIGGCIYLQKSGKGKIAGSISAKYKIRPSTILTQVDAETKKLFNRVVNRETIKPIEIIRN